jgi:DNA-binding NarL/FixJ family response regulator
MRILLIAEGAGAAEAIRRSMRYAPSCRIIGFVDGRRPCAGAIERERPDVVVIDDGQPACEASLDRVREARSAGSAAKIVLLVASMEPGRLDEAAAAGVDAIISKTSSESSVGMLVREIAAGNVYHAFERTTATPAVTRKAAEMLTARELEILRLVAAGMSNANIAASLWVTEQTVKFHLSNVYRKLGLANRTAASHYAHVHGLIGNDAAALKVAA